MAQISYILSDEFLTDPFQCICGYSFYKQKKNYSSEWKRNKVEIKDPIYKRWLSFEEYERQQCKRLLAINSKLTNKDIEHVITVIDNIPHNAVQGYRTITSSNYLLRYGNRLSEFEGACDTRNEWKILDLISYANKEIYDTTVKMISAVAKRIRKKILQEHRK